MVCAHVNSAILCNSNSSGAWSLFTVRWWPSAAAIDWSCHLGKVGNSRAVAEEEDSELTQMLRIQVSKSLYCHSSKRDRNLLVTLSCTVQSNKKGEQLLTAVKISCRGREEELGVEMVKRREQREEPERVTLLFIPASVLPVAFAPLPPYMPARPTTLVLQSQNLISFHCFFFQIHLFYRSHIILILNSFMAWWFCQTKAISWHSCHFFLTQIFYVQNHIYDSLTWGWWPQDI